MRKKIKNTCICKIINETIEFINNHFEIVDDNDEKINKSKAIKYVLKNYFSCIYNDITISITKHAFEKNLNNNIYDYKDKYFYFHNINYKYDI